MCSLGDEATPARARNSVFVVAEKRVLHWHPSYRPGAEGA